MRRFKLTGKCIWCGKEEPLATFKNKPHILPDSVGGTELGKDICDECNSYFGSNPNQYIPSPDLLFKEIFNLKRFFDGGKSITNGEKFRSSLFPVIDNKLYIKKKYLFSPVIANQLKIAFYEIFLQKYHAYTENGHDSSLMGVVSYARYNANVCNLKVYFRHQKMWFRPTILNKTFLPFSPIILEELNTTGIFSFDFMGYTFYLDVFKQKADINRDSYFQNECNEKSILFPKIEEFNYIGQLNDIFSSLEVDEIIIED